MKQEHIFFSATRPQLFEDNYMFPTDSDYACIVPSSYFGKPTHKQNKVRISVLDMKLIFLPT